MKRTPEQVDRAGGCALRDSRGARLSSRFGVAYGIFGNRVTVAEDVLLPHANSDTLTALSW